ncbi:MAG: type II secretion system protein [Planctomycetota bacterium]|nr:type II secretion system protein [Planctomycetota bacterium]
MMRRSGFTLIELLAATALFSVLGLLLFEITRSATDIWGTGEQNREVHGRAQAALDLMAADLRHTWAGEPGAAEQDARFLVTMRTENGDSTEGQGFDVTALAFTRLLYEAREVAWLRHAGDSAGGERTASLVFEEDPGEVRATGGLAETAYTLLHLKGREFPSLMRKVRTPLGGPNSLVDLENLGERDHLVNDAVAVAEGVLFFGVDVWGPETDVWDIPHGEERGGLQPSFPVWDSTRALLGSSFVYHTDATSLLNRRDDMFPRMVRVRLVLDAQLPVGRLSEDVTAASRAFNVSSASFLGDESQPDHLLLGQEWVRVLSVTGRQLTVERGVRGSVAIPHETGEALRLGRTFDRVLRLPTGKENFNR